MVPIFYVVELGFSAPSDVEFLVPSMTLGSSDHGGTAVTLHRDELTSVQEAGDVAVLVTTGRRGFYSVFTQRIEPVGDRLKCIAAAERKLENGNTHSLEEFWILKPGSSIEVSFADGEVLGIYVEDGELVSEIIQTSAMAHEAYGRIVAEKLAREAPLPDLPDGASLEHALLPTPPRDQKLRPVRLGDAFSEADRKRQRKPRAKKAA